MESKKVKISVRHSSGVVEKMEVQHPDMSRYISMFGGYTETDVRAMIYERLRPAVEHLSDIEIL